MKRYKKSVSVWVGYLMYLLFALSALTIVLYTVNKYLDYRETELATKTIVKEILDIEDSINTAITCQKCSLTYYVTVPRNSRLDIDYDTANKILTIKYKYISKANYTDRKFILINSTVLNFTMYKKGDSYLYSFWKDIQIPDTINTVESYIHVSTNTCINVSKYKDPSNSNNIVLNISLC